MRLPLTIEVIFPIRDGPSARLMSLKAECLHIAGVISEHEEQAVLQRAAEVLTVSDCVQAVSRQNETTAYAATAAN